MKEIIPYMDYYLSFPNQLVKTYPELNFENHCYLRIALDNVIGMKWDTRIPKPAYRNLSTSQRSMVIAYLAQYLDDKDMLLVHNAISLAYRGKLV